MTNLSHKIYSVVTIGIAIIFLNSSSYAGERIKLGCGEEYSKPGKSDTILSVTAAGIEFDGKVIEGNLNYQDVGLKITTSCLGGFKTGDIMSIGDSFGCNKGEGLKVSQQCGSNSGLYSVFILEEIKDNKGTSIFSSKGVNNIFSVGVPFFDDDNYGYNDKEVGVFPLFVFSNPNDELRKEVNEFLQENNFGEVFNNYKEELDMDKEALEKKKRELREEIAEKERKIKKAETLKKKAYFEYNKKADVLRDLSSEQNVLFDEKKELEEDIRSPSRISVKNKIKFLGDRIEKVRKEMSGLERKIERLRSSILFESEEVSNLKKDLSEFE